MRARHEMRLARLSSVPHIPRMTGQDHSWRPYLDPEEVILWQGRPQPGWSWRAGENGTILLGLFVIGFVLFAVIDSLASGQSGPIGGLIVFVIIGLVIAASGPVAMAVVRRGTWYTLTDRRALIAHWPTLAGITLYRGVDCYPITEVALVPADLRGLETVNVSRLSHRHTFAKEWRRAGSLTGATGPHGAQPRRYRDHQVGFERLAEGAHVAALCRKVLRDRQGRCPDNLPSAR